MTRFWRCEDRGSCNGRLHVKDKVRVEVKKHTHKPDPCRVEALASVTKMKKRARDTEETTSSVKLQEYVDPRLEFVLEYIEDTYVGRPTRNGARKKPRFEIEWWNVYSRTLRRDPRTNNCAEAGHRKLQQEFSFSHPTLWQFITTLRRCQRARDLEYTQMEAGGEGPKKRRKYVSVDERIYRVVADFPNRSIIEYLRGIAYNL